MIRFFRILILRWRCWWTQIALDIDAAQIAIHIPSKERNLKHLSRLEFQLDQLYAPSSLIIKSLRRTSRL